MRRLASIACVAGLLALGAAARANPLDTFGLGSRLIGAGGAGTASAGSYEACYYNPAGLARLEGPELGIGTLLWRPFLKANGRDSASNRTRYLLDVGFASPIPLGKAHPRVLFAGITVTFPGTTLYTVRAKPRTAVYFPLLEDRNRRLALNLAVAARPIRQLMLGVGLSLLPDVLGEVRADFTTGGVSNSTSVDVRMHLSANAGILVEPIDGLRLGLAWRGENRTWLSMPVQVSVSEQIPPVNLRVLAYDYSTPHEIALGASWERGRWTVSGDVTYLVYRRFRQSAPTVVLYDAAGNPTGTSQVGSPSFHDAVAVRAGAEWRVIDGLALRAGLGYTGSPVPAQTGDTNLLDGDRYTGSLGIGYDFGALGVPVALDGHVALAGLVPNRDAKRSFVPENPGYPSIGSSGLLVNAGLTARARFW